MKTNMKLKGFTLIELLVVIVIIGILATISVATFSGYFAKARDSERATVVQTAATIMKTAKAVDTISTYDGTTTAGNFGTTIAAATELGIDEILLEEGGYALPNGTSPRLYYYISDGEEFAFVVCGEETTGEMFASGTPTMVATAQGTAATICLATPIPPTDTLLDVTAAGVYDVIDMTT